MSQGLTTLSYHAGLYIVADIMQRGVAFLLIPLYTLYLSPSDYGILSVTTAFSGVVSIFFLQSMEGAFNRFYYDFKTEHERKNYYGSVWIFLVVYVLGLAVFLERYGLRHEFQGIGNVPYLPFLRLSLWTACITSITLLMPRSILRVKEKVWQFSGLNIISTILTVALTAYYVGYLKQGAVGSLKGAFIASIFVAFLGLYVIFGNIRLQFNIGYVRRSLAYALPLAPHMLSLWALNLSDRFILERFVDLEKIGIYALGYQIASILQFIAYSATNAISPFYFKTASQNSDPGPILTNVANYYLIFLAWVATAIIGIGPMIIKAISTNPAYLEAGKVIPWVVMGMYARGFYFVFVMAIYYSKKLRWLPVITVVAGLVNIALNLIFVPRFGYMAAAVNTMAAFILQTILVFVYAQKCYHLRYNYKQFLHLIVIFLTINSVLWYLISYDEIIWFIAKFLLVISFPLVLFITGFFSKTELAWALKSIRYFNRSHWNKPCQSQKYR